MSTCFNPFSAGTVFRRQNLTAKGVRQITERLTERLAERINKIVMIVDP